MVTRNLISDHLPIRKAVGDIVEHETSFHLQLILLLTLYIKR